MLGGDGLYIESIKVKGFRKFDSKGIEFKFNKGINIILGENNAGKSAIIDILRILISLGQYKRGIYVGLNDFHINSCGERENGIEIDVYFSDLSVQQSVSFYQLINGKDTGKAEIHLKYFIVKDKKGNERVRENVTGGQSNVSLDKEIFDNINAIFMPALRNAESDLKPSKNSQLARLLNSFAQTEAEKARIVSVLEAANTSISQDRLISDIEKVLNTNLKLIEKSELNQKVSVSMLPPTFDEIAASLSIWYKHDPKYRRIKKGKLDEIKSELAIECSDSEIIKTVDEENLIIDMELLKKNDELESLYENIEKSYVEKTMTINQNGLGYNNLLSMAATLGDLQKQPTDEEFSIFLVEEPEAHLHPQLLDLLFNFFKSSNSSDSVQIFMTSHSPTLISKADIDSIHILYGGIDTLYTSLINTGLNENEKEDIKRYMDVTKSQLFFARRVMFVEGISEALLINEFSKLLDMQLDKYSIEIVNIDGVAFEPFINLFKKTEGKEFINIPCAVLSDNDRCTNKEDSYSISKEELTYSRCNFDVIKEKLKNGEISERAKKLLRNKGSNIKVSLAEKTFEYELAKIPENNKLLLEILEGIHPKIAEDIKTSISKKKEQEIIAIQIWIAILDCKGIFAQRLASEINKIVIGKRNDVTFIVPEYIKSAIEFLISS